LLIKYGNFDTYYNCRTFDKKTKHFRCTICNLVRPGDEHRSLIDWWGAI
jgi:hypothetical protein